MGSLQRNEDTRNEPRIIKKLLNFCSFQETVVELLSKTIITYLPLKYKRKKSGYKFYTFMNSQLIKKTDNKSEITY